MPTSASTRRTPEPIDASPSSLTRPSWPERCACVPPHSSRAQSPTATTRTASPYFSPNSAIAPESRASSWVMNSACTARSSSSTSLTLASTSDSTDTGSADGALKSNRNRPGAFSEPAWVAVSPSASRIALCTRWVAVWAREIARRRSMSTSACAAVAGADLAGRARLARCTISPVIGDCTSRTSTTRAVRQLDHARVGELAAALGVERRPVEDQLDLVALAGGRRPARRPRAARRPAPREVTSW